MLRVGLTGGIASGKSHVRRRLEAAGLATLDLDEVAHRLIAPGGPAHADVVAAFGPHVVAADGTIDRKALGAVVFADPSARARLNALVHPRVREEEERAASGLAPRPGAILVTDAALIVEVGAHLRFDRLVVVHCPPDQQLRRLRKRDGLDEAAARARLGAQMSGEEKRRFAHYTIDSSGTADETLRQVDLLVPVLREVALHERRPVAVPPGRALGSLAQGPARVAGGLEVGAMLSALASAEWLDLQALAERARPRASAPWYGGDQDEAGGPPAASSMAPLVLWSLARRGVDPPWLASAAASVARLTHRAAESLAGAVLFALALAEVATAGSVDPVATHLDAWTAAATRWGGAAPQPEVVAAIRSAAAGEAGPGSLAGALAGMAQGIPESAGPPGLRAALQALSAGGG